METFIDSLLTCRVSKLTKLMVSVTLGIYIFLFFWIHENHGSP